MKKLMLFCLSAFIYHLACSQVDTTKMKFLELVDKVQNDKSLTGTFIYKGYKVNISEYTEYKTAIGKFIQIEWVSTYPYKAIYHNTLGYMTRRLFENYKRSLKDYKVEKNKYCQNTYCYELMDDNKLPYMLQYFRNDSEIRVIK